MSDFYQLNALSEWKKCIRLAVFVSQRALVRAGFAPGPADIIKGREHGFPCLLRRRCRAHNEARGAGRTPQLCVGRDEGERDR